jgi:hypothetical protein
MPIVIRTDERPLEPGEARLIAVMSDTPSVVRSSCFYDTPPPGGFGPCAECATIKLAAGPQAFMFRASIETWRHRSGTVVFSARADDGSEATVRIRIHSTEVST